jgi:LysR family transcriptional regulator, transcription activator of glutamate synthase operon
MDDMAQQLALARGRAPVGAGLGRKGSVASHKRSEVTVHQLRVFWAIAHSDTLTKAAKQLGLAQPSLSQQLSKLEQTVGSQLFHRRSGEMTLTEAGNYLLPRAEQVLRGMRELEDGLSQYSEGKRVTVRLAGINSVLRVILPQAIHELQTTYPDADFDIQESAPGDVLEMLHGRRISVGLLAANSVAEDAVGFVQVPVAEDPYVLVVPDTLTLDGIEDPERELAAADYALVNRSIQFIFGTRHADRVAEWYDEMLPEHRVAAQCRSFELAVGLVRAGAGICLAPALSTVMGANALDGIKLYRVNAQKRRIVALVPSQYSRLEPYSTLLDTLQRVGSAAILPTILPTPPFLDRPPLSKF